MEANVCGFVKTKQGKLKRCFSNTVALLRLNPELMEVVNEFHWFGISNKRLEDWGINMQYWLSVNYMYETPLYNIKKAIKYLYQSK